MTTRERMTTAQFEDFLRTADHEYYELIDGEIVEKSIPTDEHATITIEFRNYLRPFMREHGIAGRVTAEGRYRPDREDDHSSLPDIAVIIGERPIVREGTAPFIPDICIEIQSPDNSLRKLRKKARFYVTHGAKIASIFIPKKRQIEVWAAEGFTDIEETTLIADDHLTFGSLVPGFSVSVALLFP